MSIENIGGKRIKLYGALIPLIGVFAVSSVSILRIEPTIRANTSVGDVAVGGLTKEEAARQIRIYWEQVRLTPLTLQYGGKNLNFPARTPGNLDVYVDDVASVDGLPTDSLVAKAEQKLGAAAPATSHFPLKFKLAGLDPEPIFKSIEQALPAERKASVTWSNHQLVKKEEIPGSTVDRLTWPDAVGTAAISKTAVNVPAIQAPVHVTAADLSKINDFMSSYTTRFPSRQMMRNTNIQLAANRLNGVVLLPGEVLSYNDTVGKRTVMAGFKEAPVFKHGKHDVGIGGGICQVSSTLFNAALEADLKIVERQNHSLRVGYVSAGRDATVDYGSIDLKVKNNYPFPIAITSEFQPGTLTFRVFGTAVDGQSVKIVTTDFRLTPPPVEYVNNSKLPVGVYKVTDDGKSGQSIKTFRYVYQNGKLIRKDNFGTSVYLSVPKVIEKNPMTPPMPPKK